MCVGGGGGGGVGGRGGGGGSPGVCICTLTNTGTCDRFSQPFLFVYYPDQRSSHRPSSDDLSSFLEDGSYNCNNKSRHFFSAVSHRQG